MLGHNDQADQLESVVDAKFAEDLYEKIARTYRAKKGEAPVTTAGDEVEMALTVAALESVLHGKDPKTRESKSKNTQQEWTERQIQNPKHQKPQRQTPHPLPTAQRVRHPQIQNQNQKQDKSTIR